MTFETDRHACSKSRGLRGPAGSGMCQQLRGHQGRRPRPCRQRKIWSPHSPAPPVSPCVTRGVRPPEDGDWQLVELQRLAPLGRALPRLHGDPRRRLRVCLQSLRTGAGFSTQAHLGAYTFASGTAGALTHGPQAQPHSAGGPAGPGALRRARLPVRPLGRGPLHALHVNEKRHPSPSLQPPCLGAPCRLHHTRSRARRPPQQSHLVTTRPLPVM